MDVQEIRQLDDAQLLEELDNAHRAMQNVRFRLATRQLTNTAEVRISKKTIARIRTVIRQRELARG